MVGDPRPFGPGGAPRGDHPLLDRDPGLDAAGRHAPLGRGARRRGCGIRRCRAPRRHAWARGRDRPCGRRRAHGGPDCVGVGNGDLAADEASAVPSPIGSDADAGGRPGPLRRGARAGRSAAGAPGRDLGPVGPCGALPRVRGIDRRVQRVQLAALRIDAGARGNLRVRESRSGRVPRLAVRGRGVRAEHPDRGSVHSRGGRADRRLAHADQERQSRDRAGGRRKAKGGPVGPPFEPRPALPCSAAVLYS